MRVLGINAVFHDPAAALIVDGRTVAAAEEERFSRRKHGKSPVPFSTWELPEQAVAWCLDQAELGIDEIDAVAYSYDPRLARRPTADITAHGWDGLRTLFAQRAGLFMRAAFPGFEPARLYHVPHHIAHAASAYLAAPRGRDSTVMVIDGRGERGSYLGGCATNGELEVLALQDLPHSLGLVYEELTAHLGFRRSSDEYKVMAMASYGKPEFLDLLRRAIRTNGDGGFETAAIDWDAFAPRLGNGGGDWLPVHADLASSIQRRLEEVLLELAEWLYARTRRTVLTMAGGVALNCVANSWLLENGPFEEIWVQPAAGDSGTALGAAMYVSEELGDRVEPLATAALGRGFGRDEIRDRLDTAGIPFEQPADVAEEVGQILASNGVVAWFQGRSEFGPRALGRRSLLADPRQAENLDRMNAIKGREQFRPVAPMVLAERAEEIFEGGPIPSPYMLFTHRVKRPWLSRIPAVVHVDGTARIQTIDAGEEPLMHRAIASFERHTGVPVVVNTSLNTAGRPMVDDPRDALELFGSAPVDALAIGPYLVRRERMFADSGGARGQVTVGG
jgi:carbamoyltransferase